LHINEKYPWANVHPDAQIGKGVRIAPFATIEADVILGDGCEIGANSCVMQGTRMGRACKVFPGAVVGAIPQDLKYQGEYTTLEIGDRVTIREFCTLNRGTLASGKTVVGDDCLLMAYVHIAHDCVLGRHCVLANGVTLAGHIEVGDWAVLGGLTAVHQFVRIGRHAMVGGGSLVRKDVPPYIRAAREPLAYVGVNTIGLERRGFSTEKIEHIKSLYRHLFVEHSNLAKGKERLRMLRADSKEADEILSFLEQSEQGRGVIRAMAKNT